MASALRIRCDKLRGTDNNYHNGVAGATPSVILAMRFK